MDFQVVAADLDSSRHAEGILAVLDAYASDPIGGGAALGEAVRARLIGELRRHPTTRIWIAERNDDSRQPIGVAVCFVGFSTFAARTLLNIHDLAVLP